VSSFLNECSCCCVVDHQTLVLVLVLVLVALSSANAVDHHALAMTSQAFFCFKLAKQGCDPSIFKISLAV
jgi:hypothetical protein